MKLIEQYKFVVREIDNIKTNHKNITICLQDKINGLVIPHPITEFITIHYSYYGKSLNSQLAPARVVCRFLNFLYLKIDDHSNDFVPLSLQGLYGLDLYHGSSYLSHLTRKGLSRKTIFHYEHILTQFYVFLRESGYIKEKFEIEYVYYNNQKRLKSLFRKTSLQTELPPKVKSRSKLKLKDFGKNRYELLTLFIQTSRQVAPEISLGICLQFFGGLRRGEVVNITRENIEATLYKSLIIQVKDNRKILFAHLKDTSSEFPKRINYLSPNMCRQTVLDNPLLWEVYIEHEEHLNRINNNTSINKKAVFLNSDGNAMSGKVYERKFKKVKHTFLNELLEQGKYTDYILLNESYWGTHIGRGVFSNLLFDMGLTVTQIAIARGDTNINSAMDYVDEKSALKAIDESLSSLKSLERTDSDHIKGLMKLWK